MVFCTAGQVDPAVLTDAMEAAGVLALWHSTPDGTTETRLVTHLDVSSSDLELVANAVEQALADWSDQAGHPIGTLEILVVGVAPLEVSLTREAGSTVETSPVVEHEDAARLPRVNERP